MAAETVDTLEIEIRSRANEAADKVKELATSISNFGKNISAYLGDLKNFASVMDQIASSAQKLGAINNLKSILNSVGKAAKSGKAAQTVKEAVAAVESAKEPIKVRAKTNEERNADAQQYRQMISDYKDRVRNARNDADLDVGRRWLAENTPEKIASQRAMFSSNKLGEQWQDLFGSRIPEMADRYRDMGLIDESTAQAMKEAAGYTQEAASAAGSLNSEAQMTADEFASTATQADLLQMKLEETGAKLEEALNSDEREPGKIAKLTAEYQNLKEKIEQVGEAAETAESGGFSLRNTLSRVGDAIDHSLIGKLKRVVTTRSLRSIVKSFASGIKEGITNLYNWSSAINGSFAGAMNTAESKITLLKNSFATVLAPAIEALTPILSTFVSWVRTAANYLAQFFALLTGSNSWTKALETTETWGTNAKKSSSAAKKASDDVKDLLADWDELNIIQQESTSSSGSGGSGSGKTTTDYSKMFENVTEFNKEIKALVQNLKDNFGSILNFVGEIAAIILAWKVSSAFAGIVGTLAGFVGAGIVIDLVFKLTKTFADSYLDTGNEGWLFLSMLTPVVGGFVAGELLKQINAFGLAKFSLPISLAVGAAATITAVVSNTDVSALDERSIKASIVAAVEGGAAAGLFVFKAGALSAGQSALYGTGWGLVTFGVAVGLKAVADVARDGKITKETILADLTSAAFVGGGLMLAEVAAGAGVVSALTLAGGAAVFTLAALVAIEAVIASQPKAVKWGDYDMTEKEIQGFVENNMFTVKPSVQISLINATVEKSAAAKKNLEDAVTNTLGTLHALSLGLNQSDSLKQLETDVFGTGGLLESFNTYASKQTTEIQTVLKFVKFTNPLTGDDESGKISKDATEGWGTLTGIMQSYEAELRAAFEQYDSAVDEVTRNTAQHTIEKITGMMTKISEAVSFGEASASYMHAFEAMTRQGITQESADAILDTYSEMKTNLEQAARDSLTDAAKGVLGEANAMLLLSNDTTLSEADRRAYKDRYDELMADYETMIAGMDEAVEQMVDQQLQSSKGKEAFARYLLSIFDTSNFDANTVKFDTYAGDSQAWSTIFGTLFDTNGNAAGDAKDKIKNALKDVLTSAVGRENAGTFINALDLGILSYKDLFSNEIVEAMAEAMGLDTASDEIRAQFVTMINEIFGTDFKPEEILPELRVPVEVVPEVEAGTETKAEVAETVAETVEEAINDGFEWSDVNLAAGSFTDEVVKGFAGAETGEFYAALLSKLEEGTIEKDDVTGLFDKIIESAFLLTGEGDKVKALLESGDLTYADLINTAVIQSIEDAMDLGNESEELTELWNAVLDEIFSDPEIEIDSIDITGKNKFGNHLLGSAGASGGGINYTSEDHVTVDAAASGMAMDSTLANLENTVTRDDSEQSSLMNSMIGFLRNIADYSRTTANKDFTVVISPSSAMGGVMAGSSRKRSKVTGDLVTQT